MGNIEKHGKTGRIWGKRRKIRENRENQGQTQNNTGKQEESGENVKKTRKNRENPGET